jgi:hypothetical protein
MASEVCQIRLVTTWVYILRFLKMWMYRSKNGMHDFVCSGVHGSECCHLRSFAKTYQHFDQRKVLFPDDALDDRAIKSE